MHPRIVLFAMIGTVAATGAHAAPCGDPVACAKACSARNTAACVRAAEAYFNGQAVALDARKSFALARTACDAGDVEGCSLLGCHYQDGVGTAWSPAQAVAVYDKACRRGSGLACLNLSGMYSGGHGVVVDEDKFRAYRKLAIDTWRAACGGDGVRWCSPLAAMLDDGDGDGAMKLVAHGCERGASASCAELARRQLKAGKISGEAFLRDEEIQCRAGEAHGCSLAGAALVLGDQGVAQDAARGVELQKRACSLGDSRSCAGVGGQYARGEGVPNDLAAAARYFEMACDRRLALACLMIAQEAQRTHDAKRTIEFARRACQMNSGEACELAATSLGEASRDGIRWATEACRMGRLAMCVPLIERDVALPAPAHAIPQLYAEACERGVQQACKHVAK